MADTGIELKGSTFTLSVLHLTDTDPQQIKELLETKVAQAPQFFNFAPLVVNVERLENTPDFEALKETIEREDFVLVGVSGARDEATKVAAKAAGLAVMTAGKVVTPSAPEPVVTAEKIMSRRSLRPGCIMVMSALDNKFTLRVALWSSSAP